MFSGRHCDEGVYEVGDFAGCAFLEPYFVEALAADAAAEMSVKLL